MSCCIFRLGKIIENKRQAVKHEIAHEIVCSVTLFNKLKFRKLPGILSFEYARARPDYFVEVKWMDCSRAVWADSLSLSLSWFFFCILVYLFGLTFEHGQQTGMGNSNLASIILALAIRTWHEFGGVWNMERQRSTRSFEFDHSNPQLPSLSIKTTIYIYNTHTVLSHLKKGYV